MFVPSRAVGLPWESRCIRTPEHRGSSWSGRDGGEKQSLGPSPNAGNRRSSGHRPTPHRLNAGEAPLTGRTPRSDGTQGAPPPTIVPRLSGHPLDPSASAWANATTPSRAALPSMRQASRCESERTTRAASVGVGRAQPGPCSVSVYATSGRRIARTLACCDARGRFALVALPRGTTRRLEDALVKRRRRWGAGDRTIRSMGEGKEGGAFAADVAGGAAGGAQDPAHQGQVTVFSRVVPRSGGVDRSAALQEAVAVVRYGLWDTASATIRARVG
jgi:hypothetical protein